MKRKAEIINSLIAFIVVVGLFYSLGSNFKHTASWASGQLKTIIPRRSASPDEKWEVILGDYYEFVRFVEKKTPPDAKILIPPGRTPMNIWMHNYFLFPRQITRCGRAEEIDYVVVYGATPDPEVKGGRIMLDEKRGLIKVGRGGLWE